MVTVTTASAQIQYVQRLLVVTTVVLKMWEQLLKPRLTFAAADILLRESKPG